ncbi:MAG: DNA (cytosine-5-)-methyltransferase [Candidatus Gastranaerophilales bacterium]|nr:DNA (cytosine-5-)-methyltransferase [Candidatus Gastranaerophilales bacterium]
MAILAWSKTAKECYERHLRTYGESWQENILNFKEFKACEGCFLHPVCKSAGFALRNAVNNTYNKFGKPSIKKEKEFILSGFCIDEDCKFCKLLEDDKLQIFCKHPYKLKKTFPKYGFKCQQYERRLTFFDCFAGIGGFHLGMTRAGFKCAGWCELDKYCQKLYRAYHNVEGLYFEADATKINTAELPEFDILVGGFPCQAFSIAGKRQGFDDVRGTLFFELARILKDKRPRYFIFENVKGLLSHDDGKTFATIIGVLANIGYSVEWQVLNSKFFGVPQNRERVFIVGHLGGECGRKIFPIREATEFYNESNENKEEIHNIASTMTARQYASWNGNFVAVPALDEITENVADAHRVYNMAGIARTLKSEGGGLGAKTGLYVVGNVNYDGFRIRRLTPLECFRLQGFPDDMVAKAHEIGISDSQLYKMAGNSVTVNVVQEIARRIKSNDPAGLCASVL